MSSPISTPSSSPYNSPPGSPYTSSISSPSSSVQHSDSEEYEISSSDSEVEALPDNDFALEVAGVMKEIEHQQWHAAYHKCRALFERDLSENVRKFLLPICQDLHGQAAQSSQAWEQAVAWKAPSTIPFEALFSEALSQRKMCNFNRTYSLLKGLKLRDLSIGQRDEVETKIKETLAFEHKIAVQLKALKRGDFLEVIRNHDNRKDNGIDLLYMSYTTAVDCYDNLTAAKAAFEKKDYAKAVLHANQVLRLRGDNKEARQIKQECLHHLFPKSGPSDT